MTPARVRAARLAAPLAAALLLTVAGCGSDTTDDTADDTAASGAAASEASPDSGGSGTAAPQSAAVAALCTQLTSAQELSNGQQVHAYAVGLDALDAPQQMSDEEDAGLQAYTQALLGVDRDATAEQLSKITDLGLSSTQKQQIQAFFTYANQACAAG